jgi:hypothetical protein
MKFGIEESTEICRRCPIPDQIEQQFPLTQLHSIFCPHIGSNSLKRVSTDEQTRYPQHKRPLQCTAPLPVPLAVFT